MHDLTRIIEQTLRNGGEYTVEQLTAELNFRVEHKLLESGIVGAGAVAASLRSLQGRGRARVVDGSWEFVKAKGPAEKERTLF